MNVNWALSLGWADERPFSIQLAAKEQDFRTLQIVWTWMLTFMLSANLYWQCPQHQHPDSRHCDTGWGLPQGPTPQGWHLLPSSGTSPNLALPSDCTQMRTPQLHFTLPRGSMVISRAQQNPWGYGLALPGASRIKALIRNLAPWENTLIISLS